MSENKQDAIGELLANYASYQIKLYKALGDSTNPYTLYNNNDRFLNVSIRYLATTNWRDFVVEDMDAANFSRIKAHYEFRTARYSQYLGASTAYTGIAYSVMSQPGIIGNATGKNEVEQKRDFSDAEWGVLIFRSSFNALLKSILVPANYYRHPGGSEGIGLIDIVPPQAGNFANLDQGNEGGEVIELVVPANGNHPPDPDNPNITTQAVNWVVVQGGQNRAAQVNVNAEGQPGPNQAPVANVNADQILKENRAKIGAGVNFFLGVNALIGLGMSSARMVKVANDGNVYDKWSASLGFLALSANSVAYFARSYAQYQTLIPGADRNALLWSQVGTGLGLANGLFSIFSIAPLVDKAHDKKEKLTLGLSLGAQLFFGAAQIGVNQVMAARIANGLTSVSELSAPLLGMFTIGILGSLSAVEIYGFVKQWQYADQLDTLGARMHAVGYDGDTYLAELYRDKLDIEIRDASVIATLSTVALAVQIATISMGPGAAVAELLGMTMAIAGSILKGMQQSALESIANDAIQKIKDSGGSVQFFSNNINAIYDLERQDPAFNAELQRLQADYQVDSVVGITSTQLSHQALELAAFTKFGANLYTAGFNINRFVDGTAVADQSLRFDSNSGMIDLRNSVPVPAKQSQLLKFLSPLMAPGEEKRSRVSTGKNSYYTELEILSAGQTWTILDGAMTSTIDVRNVVTTLFNVDKTVKFSVGLKIEAGAGDDLVFAGGAAMRFDGGDGFDSVSYGGLAPESHIEVTAKDPNATDSQFDVKKTLIKGNYYQEVIASASYTYGKRTEVVEYRDINISTFDKVVASDTLINVENISGSPGDDLFTGNAGSNIFRGEGGNDRIAGLDGNDVLIGGQGNDTLAGGAGNDTAVYQDNPGGSTYGIRANLETAQRPDPALIVGAVEEQWRPGVNAYPAQTLDVLIDIENLQGTTNADFISGSRVGNLLGGGEGNDVLLGLAGNDTLIGGAGDDFADGGADDDNIDGGAGRDTQMGGSGNDYFLQNDGGLSGNSDAIDGGDGDDTMDYSPSEDTLSSLHRQDMLSINANLVTGIVQKDWNATVGSFVNVDMIRGIENVIGTDYKDTISGDANDNQLLGMSGDDIIAGGAGNDLLFGGACNDVLSGDDGNDMIAGGVGNDLLQGGAGDDILSGGEGTDTLVGGAGIDRVDFLNASGPAADGVCAVLGTPADTAGSMASFGHRDEQGAFVATAGKSALLRGIEDLAGTDFADRLVGNEQDNYLLGNKGDDYILGLVGDDTITGGEGADDLQGGDGADRFLQSFDAANDTIDGGAGVDAVDYSSADTNGGTLSDSPGNLGIAADLTLGKINKFTDVTLAGAAGIDVVSNIEIVTGTSVNDRLFGDANPNGLFGAAGNDTLDGRDGDDWLDGGGGNDTLTGGTGNDVLLGGEGADSMNGGAGDDLFLQFGELKNDIILGGSGLDRVSYENATFTAAQIAALQSIGIAADLTTGRIDKFHGLDAIESAPYDMVAGIEGMVGSILNDTIIGDEGKNNLAGIAGNDVLLGGSGNDILAGGEGTDDVHGDAGDDLILQGFDTGADTLDGGEGIDTLDYTLAYADDATARSRNGLGLVANMETGLVWKMPGETSNGVDHISHIEQLHASTLDDKVTGDAAANLIDGIDGNDTLDGGGEDDTIDAGYGNDSVAGGAGDDALSGGPGNDTVSGAAGDDTVYQLMLREHDVIDGGEGRDMVDYSVTQFDAGSRPELGHIGIRVSLQEGRVDKFEAGSLDGYDTLTQIENVIGTALDDIMIGDAANNYFEGGTGNDTLLGGAGDDVLAGSSGNDLLVGGEGADYIAGGPGDETLDGGAGSDFYSVLAHGGVDVIRDHAAGSDAGDILQFGSRDGGAIVSTSLWFVRSDNDLNILMLGTTDQVTVSDWFANATEQIEIFWTADGMQLTNQNLPALLQAMAGKPVPVSSAAVTADVLAAMAAQWTPIPSASSAAATASGELAQIPLVSFQRSAQAPLSFGVAGNAEANALSGQAGNDTLDGAAGNDTLEGGEGHDLMLGSAGDDVLSGMSGNDSLQGGDGVDALYGGSGADLIDGGDGNDMIWQDLTRTVDTIIGGTGFDAISYGEADLTANARAGLGSSGIVAALASGRIDKFGVGSDTGYDLVSQIEGVIGTALDDTMMGDDADNVFIGGAGADSLLGANGNDTLQGDAGDDTLAGGAGDDLVMGLAGNDRMLQTNVTGNDTFIGGGGFDLIDYSAVNDDSATGIRADLAAGKVDKSVAGVDVVSDIDGMIGTDFDDALSGDWFNNSLAGGAGRDTLAGGAGDDTLTGDAGNDVLAGGADADLVNGGAGDDLVLESLTRERDTIAGGDGVDTLDYSATGSAAGARGWLGLRGITAKLASGRIDKFEAGSDDGVDSISGIENVTGSQFNDDLSGDAQDNVLAGADGNDTLSGDTGNDTLRGDAGDDLIVQDALGGHDEFDGGSGFDRVDYSGLRQAGTAVMVDLAAGSVQKFLNGVRAGSDTLRNIEAVTGTANNDMISGSAAADVLDGGGGNDTLSGREGDDRLLQSRLSGNESFDGGAGKDTVDYRDAVLVGGGIRANLASGTVSKLNRGVLIGSDVLRNVEGIVGTRYADTLVGSNGDDDLTGGGGNDVISGGAGRDHFFVTDAGSATLDGGSDSDTVDYSAFTLAGAGILVDFVAGTVTKSLNGVVVGIDRLANMEALIGSGRDDTLQGSSGGDSLDGSAGNDKVAGGDGNDTLDGGSGRDTLLGGAGNDSICGGDDDDLLVQIDAVGNDTLDGGQGADSADYSQFFASGTHVVADLAAGTVAKYQDTTLVGIDTLIQIEVINGTVNADLMTGATAAALINGKAGDDTLTGGAGMDTLDGGSGNDVVFGGDGNDLLLQADVFGQDTLDGGAAIDTVDYRQLNAPGSGVDIDLVSARASKLYYGDVRGTDTLVNIEALIGTLYDDTLRGGTDADLLSGADGNDSLDGGGSNDTLNGGAGNDTLKGGRLADLLHGDMGDDWLLQDDVTGADTLDGGSDHDTADYSLLAGSEVHIELDLAGGVVRKYSAGSWMGSDLLLSIEAVFGTRLDDTLRAGALADYLNGGGGNDVLDGGAGDDTLNGGSGKDAVNGGDGNDLIVADEAGAGDTIVGGVGFDTLDFSQASSAVGGIVVDLAAGSAFRSDRGNAAAVDLVRDIEALIGTRFDDTLSGSVGNDVLIGGDGNDRLVQANLAGDDTLDGAAGVDTLDYSRIYRAGAALVVDLVAGSVQKSVNGVVTGRDSVAGIELVLGSTYGDVINGSEAGDSLSGWFGNDTLAGGTGNDSLDGGDGDDWLNGGAGNDSLFGGNGNDRIVQDIVAGSDSISGGAGFDTLAYSIATTTDVSVVVNIAASTVTRLRNGSVLGNDTFSGIEAITGTRNGDVMSGSLTADILDGGDGNDTLDGSAGNDALNGAGGNDRFVQNDQQGRDTLDGGSGVDSVDYSGLRTAAISLDHGQVKKFVNGGLAGTDTLTGVEVIIGTSFNDTIVADAADNLLTGGGGRDLLQAGEGNDAFLQTGVNDNDTLDGGIGSDVADYSGISGAAGASLGIDANLGAGWVRKSDNGFVTAIDSLSNVEGLIGSGFNDTMVGSAANNLLAGGAGDDYFLQDVPLKKNDTIDGGEGIDTVDYRKLRATPGTVASISYNLAEGWVKKYEDGVLVGTDALRNIDNVVGNLFVGTVVGSDSANDMRASFAADVLQGLGGDDLMVQTVWRGDDVFDGGTGIDTLDYSQFLLQTDAGGLDANLAIGRVRKFNKATTAGTDYVSNIERVLGTGFDDVMVGNGQPNLLQGGGGDDTLIGGNIVTNRSVTTLDGGAGNDVLRPDAISQVAGGDGNDTIYIKDTITYNTVDGGAGSDTIDFSYYQPYFANYDSDPALQQKLFAFTLTINGFVPPQLGSFTNIENVVGTPFNDVITGDGGANVLSGASGNDVLSGAGGNDTLNGGVGNDMLQGGVGDDVFLPIELAGNDTLAGGDGVDRADYSQLVQDGAAISASLTSARVLKYLDGVVTGTDTLSSIEKHTGSPRNDTLNGSLNADSLSGGGGNDLIAAGDGNDVILQDQTGGDDTLDGGVGIDTLDYSAISQADFTIAADLGAGRVTRTFAGRQSGIDVVSNIEQLIASRGNDTLSGSINADSLAGGAGLDLLRGGAGSDVLSGGLDADMLDGGHGDDVLNGDDGNDTLNGGFGNDQIFGGLGDDWISQTIPEYSDTLDGGAGIDTVDYSPISTFLLGGRGINANLATGLVDKSLTSPIIALDTLRNIEGVIGTYFDDTLTGGVNNDVLSAGDGNDVLDGGAGDDMLNGGNGNDKLTGGIGNDSLSGGAGSDLVNSGLGDDRLIEDSYNGNDTLDGGAGRDLLDYSQARTAQDLPGGLNASLADGWVRKYENGVQVGTDTLLNIESLIGTLFNDTLTGDDGANLLEGGPGDDWLSGRAGNDTLNGGGGNDIYNFGKVWGQVTIHDTAGSEDLLKMTGLSVNELSVARVGNDLAITRSAAPDKPITIADWYSGTDFQIEYFGIGTADLRSSDLAMLGAQPQLLRQFARVLIALP